MYIFLLGLQGEVYHFICGWLCVFTYFSPFTVFLSTLLETPVVTKVRYVLAIDLFAIASSPSLMLLIFVHQRVWRPEY